MTLIATTTALCEVLRQEQRATFHNDLLDLVNSIENIRDIIGLDKRSTLFLIITYRIAEL
jgi:hypothetical protein